MKQVNEYCVNVL